MTRSLTPAELAEEGGVPIERLEWLTRLGVLAPDTNGNFAPGDTFRVKTVESYLSAGVSREQLETAAAYRIFNLDYLDRYFLEPAPPAHRSFAEFAASIEQPIDILRAIYEVLGLAAPDPARPLRTDEEEILADLLAGWRLAADREAVVRAARLVGEGTRLATVGWSDLFNETISGPTAKRFLEGEDIEEASIEVMRSGVQLAMLVPKMMVWLGQRYLEQAIAEESVEGFEEFLASRGLAPVPGPREPPAVAFVDLSGYTRLTEEGGDESAAHLAGQLRDSAEGAALRYRGRLVKLLGDGALLVFPTVNSALPAALDLVARLREETGVLAHAGVHAGAVVERDRDVFGRTVNLAARLAASAAPGEVVASADAIGLLAEESGLRTVELPPAELKGVDGMVRRHRVERLAEPAPSVQG